MAEKELPPLRVRILGDDSHFKGVLKDVAKNLNATNQIIARSGDSEFERIFSNYRLLQKSKDIGVANEINNINLLQKAKDAAFQRDFNNLLLLERIRENERRAADASAAAREAAADARFAERQRLRQDAETAIANARRSHDEAAAAREAAADARFAERQRLRQEADAAEARSLQNRANQSLDRHRQEREMAAGRARSQQAFLDELDRIRNANEVGDREQARRRRNEAREQAAIRRRETQTRIREARLAQREQEQNLRRWHQYRMGVARQFANFQQSLERRRAARPDMGFGLGSRADIYMHMNALKNLFQSGKGMVGLAGNFEQAQVGIEAFSGSAQRAAEVMKEIQDYAIASPYQTIQLAEMARNMMSYGVSSDAALAVIRNLGDVAGGSTMRLERLSFAMSQISSMGRLQGQELRQLTEQGFNPLETISRHTGKSMLELKKLMEDGGVSAKAVTEALKAETSAGGRFAGVAARMQQSLPGLVNQIKELAQKLGLGFMKAIEQDLKNALLVTIEKLKEFIAYLETPAGQQMVKRMAGIAVQVLKAAVAFHVIGLAISIVRWQVASLATILSVLQGVMVPLRMVMSAFVGPLMLIGHLIQAILSGSIMSFIGFAAGFAQTILGLGVLGVGIAAVRDMVKGSGGLTEAFKQLPSYIKKASDSLSGFFFNIKENWTILLDWFIANYSSIAKYVESTMNSVLSAIGNNILVLGNFLIDVFSTFIDWLEANMPAIVDRITKAIDSAIQGIAKGFGKSKSVQRMAVGYASRSMTGGIGMGNILKMMGLASPFGSSLKGVDAEKLLADVMVGKSSQSQSNLTSPFLAIAESAKKAFDNLESGFDPNKPFGGLKLPEFNLTVPELKIPKVPELVLPPNYTPDFSDLGKGMVGKLGLTDTAMYRSSDHAKRIYEYSRNMQAIQSGLRGETAKDDIPKQQLNALKGIEKNTRPGAPAPTANLSGTNGGSF